MNFQAKRFTNESMEFQLDFHLFGALVISFAIFAFDPRTLKIADGCIILALETNCLGCIARVTYQDKFSNADL
jgi:hypothetical protein